MRQALVVLFVAGAAGLQAADRPEAKPNVVIVLADQWRAQATGFAGDRNARTPRLDRLATAGVVLSTAVSTCPVCSPYRASLLTGRYPINHGVFVNDVHLGTEAVSLAQAFARSGYATGYIGKWHLDGHGRSSFIPPDRRQGFEFWRANECSHDYLHSPYYADTNEKRYWEGYDAIAQTEAAKQYILSHRQQLFLLVVAWGPPHNPYDTAPKAFRDMFQPEHLELRPNVPSKVQAATRRDLAGYYAHIAALDTCVGHIVDTLQECQLAQNTVLIVTADHGDMLGSHAEVRKQRPWDESILVPLVVCWPQGLGQGGRRLSAPLGTPDIMPTLLGLCGIKAPDTVDGDDRSAWLRGREPDTNRAALICCVSPFGEWTRNRGGREYRGLRTNRYTYVRSLAGPWLLYDNQQDPYQQDNLIGHPQFAAIQADLDRKLTQELKRHQDDFQRGGYYLKKWNYRTDAEGTVPYSP
jgi:arylsulfatase A-like enzyme